MHARIAVFEQRDPAARNEFRSLVEMRADAWEQQTGAKAFYALFEPSASKGYGLTLFEDEHTLRQAEPVFEQMGEEVPERLRGKRNAVMVHQVLAHDVTGSPAAVRISRLKGAMASHEDAYRHAIEKVLRQLQDIDGWCGLIACANDATGEAMTFTLWESEEALERSEEQADAMRKVVATEAEQEIEAVERCEVVFSHDRAPRLVTV